MNTRSQFLERHGEDRRLVLAVAVALGLHLVLLLASKSPLQTRLALMVPRNELDVRLQEEASPAPGAPGGHAGDLDADEAEPKPVRAAPRAPVKAKPVLAKAIPREVLSAPEHDLTRDRVAAPTAQPLQPVQPVQPPAAPAPQPAPTNSRDPEWRRTHMGPGMGSGSGSGLGSGSGRGGLFGSGRVVGDGPGALEARVCFIPETTRFIRDVQQCNTIFQQFLDEIDVPARRFEDGFPGFEERTEWFAVTIQGTFTVPESGLYQFRLKADDGAVLYIDGELTVDNDGIHGAVSKRGSVDLREGRHRIVVRYFQGMKYELALQLFVTPPGGKERLFRSEL